MGDPGEVQYIESDDFARRFGMRGRSLMWFLGAGASAAAGIPTATDMIWEFKQRLFVTQRKVSASAVSDLSNSVVRSQLQDYIDSASSFPPAGAAEEYASLFEAVYVSDSDRRAYLDSKMMAAKASYGHLALATLMRANLTNLVWTTNFDPLVADACAKVFSSTGALSTVDLDAPKLAAQLIAEQRWPVEIKLHGDFRSRALKNTTDELRLQDSQLRRILVDSCKRFGLIVMGYSGRDNSVMDTLEEALSQEGAFPAGLFWMQRAGADPLPRVQALVRRAAELKIEAGLVQIENFDETLRDLLRLRSDIDTQVADDFCRERRRWSPAPRPSGKPGWPVVRLNGIEVQTPTVCRRIACGIGGYNEVRAALKKVGCAALVGRIRAGVLAYGRDQDLRAAFEEFDITDFDLHTIEKRRLQYDSAELGLLFEALIQAISRHRNLMAIRRRGNAMLFPADVSAATWKPLAGLVGSLNGTVGRNTELTWNEGVELQLSWADGRLWLLVEPRTVFEGIARENKPLAAEFARERKIRRYNLMLNHLLDFWSTVLIGDGSELRALGIGDGVDAAFRFSNTTGFSWRLRG